MIKNISLLLFLLSIVSCSKQAMTPMQETKNEGLSLQERADALAQKYIITDGHVDLPYRLKIKNFRLDKEYLGIPIETDEGDFDFVRSREGGLDAPFMSIYLPANLQQEAGASKMLADSLIDMVSGIAAAHPDKFKMAYNPADCEKAFEAGQVALPMGMENGSGIEDDLSNVAYFKKRGISYVTLTHSKDNLICDSSYDTTGTWMGLSPFGVDVVREMNRVGIMVDVSHISDSTFYQVMRMTDVPVIASHSSCRKFVPGFQRNMSDDMLRVLGEKGGVIQINFGSTFLDGEIQAYRNEQRAAIAKLLEEAGVQFGSPEADVIIKKYQSENPSVFSDVQKVADHIDHVVAIAGVDHVGFGSDFDGVGDSLPTGLKDVSDYPNLIAELLRRGYTESDIEKICYKNVWRVWTAVLDHAASH